jgi:wyosine [tRNA(Phe)-imidazoG37] synthetase (radical SAM superfamily)
MHRFLFGPVNSRRLGRSLGVDLLPFKTCSLDCIYCECGWTTDKTLRRGELAPTSEVIAELDDYLPAHPDIDYVTFSGSGEPTLHTGIGTIIGHLKRAIPKSRLRS